MNGKSYGDLTLDIPYFQGIKGEQGMKGQKGDGMVGVSENNK